jgi:alpha-tubulin suppressor-like RCC1 family protein
LLGTNVQAVYADWAGSHAVATVTGGVYGWGNNYSNQLFEESNLDIFTPTLFPWYNDSDPLPTHFALGSYHTLFVDGAGVVKGFGSNGDGQLGQTDLYLETATPQTILSVQPGNPVASLHASEETSFLVYNDYSSLGGATTAMGPIWGEAIPMIRKNSKSRLQLRFRL